jgi:hypothetical protein
MINKTIGLKELVNEILEGKHVTSNALNAEMNLSSYSYLFAIEQALEQRSFEDLLNLLDKSIPLHPKLMPFVAVAIKTLFTGKKSGKPKLFTLTHGEIVGKDILRRSAYKGISESNAINQEAAALGVDMQTIRRQLKKVKATPKS